MHTNAQILLNQLPTPATELAGVAWVNQYDATASLLCFARRVLYELIPRRIRDAFRQAVVFEHSVCIQVLKVWTSSVTQTATLMTSRLRCASTTPSPKSWRSTAIPVHRPWN